MTKVLKFGSLALRMETNFCLVFKAICEVLGSGRRLICKVLWENIKEIMSELQYHQSAKIFLPWH